MMAGMTTAENDITTGRFDDVCRVRQSERGGFAAEIDEIRVIRNHIAHASSGTAADYKKVLLKYYGSGSRLIPPGVFLMSKSLEPKTPLLRYAVTTRLISKELCRS